MFRTDPTVNEKHAAVKAANATRDQAMADGTTNADEMIGHIGDRLGAFDFEAWLPGVEHGLTEQEIARYAAELRKDIGKTVKAAWSKAVGGRDA